MLRSAGRPDQLSVYFRKLLKPRQMDFEYTFWVMLQLCMSPKTAYRHTAYHKQTKQQWARDDPAFTIVLCCLITASGLAYCVTYSHSLGQTALTLLSALLVDFALLGAVIASVCWVITNRLLRRRCQPHQVEQHVEWLYALDVHCNSFFPLFLELYVLQFFLSPLLLVRSFTSGALSCALYVASLSHYHYLNFLGYSALPFLERTEVFLWPIGLMMAMVPFAVLSGFNPSRFVLGLYFR